MEPRPHIRDEAPRDYNGIPYNNKRNMGPAKRKSVVTYLQLQVVFLLFRLHLLRYDNNMRQINQLRQPKGAN